MDEDTSFRYHPRGSHQPIAEAGPDQTLLVGQTVYLDGLGSSDDDHDRLTYEWSLISIPEESNATLCGPNAFNPSLWTDLVGAYEVELVVDDGMGTGESDRVTIDVLPWAKITPIAQLGPGGAYTIFVGPDGPYPVTGSYDNVEGDAELTAGLGDRTVAGTISDGHFSVDLTGPGNWRITIEELTGWMRTASTEVQVTVDGDHPVTQSATCSTSQNQRATSGP